MKERKRMDIHKHARDSICCQCLYGDTVRKTAAEGHTKDVTDLISAKVGFRLIKGFNMLKTGGEND